MSRGRKSSFARRARNTLTVWSTRRGPISTSRSSSRSRLKDRSRFYMRLENYRESRTCHFDVPKFSSSQELQDRILIAFEVQRRAEIYRHQRYLRVLGRKFDIGQKISA